MVCLETQTVGKSGYPENQLGTTCPGILVVWRGNWGTGPELRAHGTHQTHSVQPPSQQGPLRVFLVPPIPPLYSQPPTSISPQDLWDIPNTKDLPRPGLLSGVQKTDAWQVSAMEPSEVKRHCSPYPDDSLLPFPLLKKGLRTILCYIAKLQNFEVPHKVISLILIYNVFYSIYNNSIYDYYNIM